MKGDDRYWTATYKVVLERFTNQGYDFPFAQRNAIQAADKASAAIINKQRVDTAAEEYRRASNGE